MPSLSQLSITDSIMLACSIFLLWRGWNKGIIQMMLGPIAFILGLIAAYFYFKVSQNLPISILISIIAPLGIRIILSLILNLTAKKEDGQKTISLLSRILGSALEWSWGIFFIILMVVLLGILPKNFPGVNSFQPDIHRSKTFQLTQRYLPIQKHDDFKKITNTFAQLQNPKKIEQLQKTPEYQALYNDKAFKEILSDPQVVKAIEKGQLAELLKNPKFLKLLHDPQTIQKFLNFQKRLLQE